MEAEINQPLGDVLIAYAGFFLQWPDVDNALMRNTALAAGIKHVIGVRQPCHNIIGSKDRH